MYLKSISMQGFKSFAKKVNIDLSTNVTGVVGPNGSGKSNVAEAIRFVLGEQSMKGLRSKSGSDLIFKGSTHLAPLSRASVSMHLDNSEKKINERLTNKNHAISDTLINFINLDEIILTREIYADGASEYFINSTKVRLKDVQELLAMANISVAGHTIVNQGEADRILLANNNDRREMIEDALGLRIYHMRIKEGEKKLEKVSLHLKEIELVRRENVPHLNFLRKQVKDLEKREDEIKGVSSMLKVYLYRENQDIENRKKEIATHDTEGKIETLEKELENLNISKKDSESHNIDTANKVNPQKENILEEINILQNKINDLDKEKDEIYKEFVNLEVEIKFLKRKEEEINSKNANLEKLENEIKEFFINKEEFIAFEGDREKLWQNIFSLYESKSNDLGESLKKASTEEKDFLKKIKNDSADGNTENKEKESTNKLMEEINLLENKLSEKKLKLEEFSEKKNTLLANLESQRKEKEKIEGEEKEIFYKLDNNILSVKLELEKLYSERENTKMKKDFLEHKEEDFESLLRDVSNLIGSSALAYTHYNEEEVEEKEKWISELPQQDLLRRIERSRMKIEESGIINAGEIMNEYKTLSERDEFLQNEINDLQSSQNGLENLIKELKDSLLLEFNTGLQKINSNFNHYFNEIFSGGKAGLSIEKIETKKVEGENILDLEEENKKEPGIEISVNLPEKKVKELQMLSGGERALTSIALIFAMSSINHPPFMVLDETDAALDESNARKYGKMIRKLAEKSKLLVITHNRETMNQCDVLYGVTIGGDGSSKLLSIKFDQATEYAK